MPPNPQEMCTCKRCADTSNCSQKTKTGTGWENWIVRSTDNVLVTTCY